MPPLSAPELLFDRELELQVLVCALASAKSADTVFSQVGAEDFTASNLQEVFKHARQVYNEAGKVDIPVLRARMGRAWKPILMLSIMDADPALSRAGILCKSLMELSEVRNVQRSAFAALVACQRWHGDLEEIREAATAVMGQVDSRGKPMATVSKLGERVLQELDDPGISPRVPTGITDLDYMLDGGLADGWLIVLGARRSVGKTAVGAHLASEAFMRGRPTLWVAQEMKAHEMVQRFLMAHSGIAIHGKRGSLSPEERESVNAAMNRISASPLQIYDRPVSIERLWNLCRRWRALGQLKLLCVDYLQILKKDQRVPEQRAISDIVVGLKHIAQEFSIPVLAMAQCRREAEKQDARVYMSHLKGSGAIEEHGDAVILMWPGGEDGMRECSLAKNRHGPTGRFTIKVDFSTMRVGHPQEEMFT